MNIKNIARNLARALAVLPFAAAAACAPGGPVEDIKNCVQICDNYQDCQDADFDRTECAEACEGRADFDDAFKAAADACENCLDEGSCAEQADACAADCDPVINQAG
jgi:hypothetical protein